VAIAAPPSCQGLSVRHSSAGGGAFNDNDNDVNLSLPPDPETMEDAMKARRLLLPARTDFGAQLDSLCRQIDILPITSELTPLQLTSSPAYIYLNE
jgi:hypothetical protein